MNNKNSANFKRQSLVVAISCMYMTIALAPVVYASDTEIYTDSTKNTTIAPNLMMVFDTSVVCLTVLIVMIAAHPQRPCISNG